MITHAIVAIYRICCCSINSYRIRCLLEIRPLPVVEAVWMCWQRLPMAKMSNNDKRMIAPGSV